MLMMIAGNEDADDVDDDNDDDDNDDDDDDDDKKSWSKQKWQSKQLFPRFSRRSAQILQKKTAKCSLLHNVFAKCVYARCVLQKIFAKCVHGAMCTARYIWRM